VQPRLDTRLSDKLKNHQTGQLLGKEFGEWLDVKRGWHWALTSYRRSLGQEPKWSRKRPDLVLER
jgi:hypothetical protein